MTRAAFLTTGTSLFHSATWDFEGGLRLEIPEYEVWTRPPLLRSPEARKSAREADLILAKLKEHLRLDNTASWSLRLASDLRWGTPDPGTVMRYSAELSTLLKVAEHEPQGDGTLGDFLRSYAAVAFVCDPRFYPGRGQASHVAASHLAAYLNALAPEWGRARVEEVPGLSSSKPEELRPADDTSGLPNLVRKLRQAAERHDSIDLVISGGYKVYGAVLAPLLGSARFRMIYIHEEGEQLLILPGQGDERRIWDEIAARLEAMQTYQ
jgi:hypothetical protein